MNSVLAIRVAGCAHAWTNVWYTVQRRRRLPVRLTRSP